MIYIFEGMDRCGKTSQITRMRQWLETLKGGLVQVHCTDIFAASREKHEQECKSFYTEMLDTMSSQALSPRSYVYDRSYLGQAVWPVLYHGFDWSDELFKKEKEAFQRPDKLERVFLIVLLDGDSEALIKRQDGRSLGMTQGDYKREYNKWMDTAYLSCLVNKVVIDVKDKTEDEVERRITEFLKASPRNGLEGSSSLVRSQRRRRWLSTLKF